MYTLSAKTMPLWTHALPAPVSKREIRDAVDYGVVHGLKGLHDQRVVYFPSCLNQRIGGAPGTKSTMTEMVELLNKAGFEVLFPKKMDTLCCGTIWESKGMPDEAQRKAAELELALWEASDHGHWPVLCDQSPCLYRMRETMQGMHLYEPAEFIERFVLPCVQITKLDTCVAVHATCSTRKMGLTESLVRVAAACATHVLLPEEIECCAFAGDKGFTEPELNAWALRKLRRQVEQAGATMGFSNSRTCEIGLTQHSGITYNNIASLVNSVASPLKR